MSIFSQFPPFDEGGENWTIYSERLEQYFLANDIAEVDPTTTNAATINAAVKTKRTTLLTVIGSTTYSLLRNLVAPAKPQNKSYEELVKLLSDHYQPVPSELVERHKFDSRNREKGEPVAVYVSQLRKMAEFCNYPDLDNTLRDRLVHGINNEVILKKLLLEKNLSLQQAIDIAQSMENVEREIKELKGASNSSDNSVNKLSNYKKGQQRQLPNTQKIKHQPQYNNNSDRGRNTNGQPSYHSNESRNTNTRNFKPCIRCTSTNHNEWECPHKESECYKCHVKDHIAKACLREKRLNHQQYQQGASNRHFFRGNFNRFTTDNRNKNTRVHNTNKQGISQTYAIQPTVQDRSQNDISYQNQYDIFHLFEANTCHDKTQNTNTSEINPLNPIKISCHVNGIRTTFELDTGSAHSLISENIQGRFPNLFLRPTDQSLSSFSGHAVHLKGQAIVEVTHGNATLDLPLLVYKGPGPSLLGRTWIFSDLKIIPHASQLICEIRASGLSLPELLLKHEALFSPGRGRLKGVKVKLYIKPDSTPRFFHARSLPYHLKSKVEEAISKLEEDEIITPIPFTDYATPIVPIMKKDGTIRICGDYKVTTNKIINTELYPLPKPEDILATLAGCTIFTRLDMRNAYNQLELDDESRKYVVINTTKGLYQYNYLPQGISSASAIFQRHMHVLLKGHEGCQPYKDDILIGGTNMENHNKKLAKVFATMENAGLKLNKDKCEFAKFSIDFLGFRLDKDGLHPQERKITAIRNAPAPKSLVELQSFLGLVNYYSRFIPRSSTLLAPLYELLNKSTEWHWSPIHQQTFDRVKQAIQTSDLLVHFDPNREVILACDASPVGIGSVISHIIDGVERPIAFASRTLLPAEKNYPQIEREALSIVFGVTHFRDYLLGKQFTLITDHQPLVTIFHEDRPIPATAAARLQRWALILSGFDYQIRYKKGSNHSNADALSRLPLATKDAEPPLPTELVLLLDSHNQNAIKVEDMARHTRDDSCLSVVMKFIGDGWPLSRKAANEDTLPYFQRRYEISIARGILLMGNRVIIPTALRPKVMEELHSTHQGLRSMKELARSKVWWPGIDRELESFSRNCQTCQRNASMPLKSFSSWPQESAPWRRIHIDYAGPIENRYLLVTIDSYSKWMEIDITSSTSSKATINCIRQHMTRFGVPLQIVSDNATCFTSAEFQTFVAENGIEHITTAPYHPASNGQAERSVRTIKSTLKKINGGTSEVIDIVNDGLVTYPEGSLELRLARLLINYRRTPVNGGRSPAEMMFNRPLLTKLDLFHPKIATHARAEISSSYQLYPPGTEVLIHNYGRGDKWITGKIIRQLGRMVFLIATENGLTKRHKNQIRRLHNIYHPQAEPTSRQTTPLPPQFPTSISPFRSQSQPVLAHSVPQSQSQHDPIVSGLPRRSTPSPTPQCLQPARTDTYSPRCPVSITPQSTSHQPPAPPPPLRRSCRIPKPRVLFDL